MSKNKNKKRKVDTDRDYSELLSEIFISDNTVEKTSSANKKNTAIQKPEQADSSEYESDIEDAGESNVIAKIITQERQKRRNKIILGITVILSICAIAAVAGFFYFNTYNPLAEEKVTLTIEGPDKAIAGEEITYQIKYANEGEIDIQNAKIIIQEPRGLQIIRTEPEMQGHSFDIGQLPAGQKGQTTIVGTLIDSLENNQKLSASIIFVPNNFNSEFSTNSEIHTALLPIDLEVTIEQPSNVVPGEKFKTSITYTYNGLFPIEQLKLTLITPKNFTVEKAEPEFNIDQDWIIENLIPNSTNILSFEGAFKNDITFETEEQRVQTFSILPQIANREKQFFPQHEISNQTKVVDQALIANLIINGQSNNQNLGLGDTLQYSLVYRNKNQDSFKDLSIQLSIDSAPLDIIDWDKIRDPNFGRLEKSSTGKTLTWTGDQIANLKLLDGNDDGTINFSLPLKDFEQLSDENINDLSKVVINSKATITLLNANNQILPAIESNAITIGLNSSIDLSVKGLYYYPDGTPIGSGPLPPRIGQTTGYIIAYRLSNQLHEIKNIEITTTLPPRVSWANDYQPTVGEVNYDAINKKLSWTINRLPISAQNAELIFQVNLIPSTTDGGKLMKLLNPTTLTAVDTVSGDTITQTYGIISTNLENDAFAIGKGIVEE